MSLYDPQEPFGKTSKNVWLGVGITAGFIMIAVHFLLLMIFRWTNGGDWIAIVLGWFVYLMSARSAAQQQYDQQKDGFQPLRNVGGAGIGASLIVFVMVWVFIVVRGVLRDLIGITIFVDPVGLFCMITLDGIAAVSLGGWGGRMVENQHKDSNLW